MSGSPCQHQHFPAIGLCSRSSGCEMNNAKKFPFRLRRQQRIDDLSHSYGFRRCALYQDWSCLPLVPLQALSTHQQILRMFQNTPTITASPHFVQKSAVEVLSLSPHRDVHQYSVISSPEDFPRQTAVDTFHKFQPSVKRSFFGSGCASPRNELRMSEKQFRPWLRRAKKMSLMPAGQRGPGGARSTT